MYLHQCFPLTFFQKIGVYSNLPILEPILYRFANNEVLFQTDIYKDSKMSMYKLWYYDNLFWNYIYKLYENNQKYKIAFYTGATEDQSVS